MFYFLIYNLQLIHITYTLYILQPIFHKWTNKSQITIFFSDVIQKIFYSNMLTGDSL